MRIFNLTLMGVVLLWHFNLFSQYSFIDQTSPMGINHTYDDMNNDFFGGGVSFYDFNQDGWDDISLACAAGDTAKFYINNGGIFSELIPPLINEDVGEIKQIIWNDYDNDGDKDLYLSINDGISRLYNNSGNLNLTDVTPTSGLPNVSMLSYGAVWGDYDNDGWLDLYIQNRTEDNVMMKNMGDGTFQDMSSITGIDTPGGDFTFCAAFVDINNDLYPDICTAEDKLDTTRVYKNLGDGTFEDISVSSGANYTLAGMGVAVGDYDGDGDLDFYLANTPNGGFNNGNLLFENNGDETFTEVSDVVGVSYGYVGWCSTFYDHDNDGDLDLYAGGAHPSPVNNNVPNILYENDGTGMYSISSNTAAVDTTISFSHAIGDYNNDGCADIISCNSFPHNTILFSNSGGTNNFTEVTI